MDPTKVKIPPLMDLNIDNITENVIRINSNNPDARMKYVLERLVVHLHDFARETRLSTGEWMAGIQFLTKTGQICTDVRQVSLVPIFDHINPRAHGEGHQILSFHKTEQKRIWSDSGVRMLTVDGWTHRNSFFCPTSLAFRCWSTRSTTPNRPTRPKGPSWVPSTPTRPNT